MSWKDLKTKAQMEVERAAGHENVIRQIKAEITAIEAQVVAELELLCNKLEEWSGMEASVQAKPALARVTLSDNFWGMEVATDGLSFVFSTNDHSEQIVFNRQPRCSYWEINNSRHLRLDVMAHFHSFIDSFVAMLRQKGMLRYLA